MYNEKIEKLIEMALLDGELTEKEKQVLFKKAESDGIDLDEFEMVLEAKLYEKQNGETQKSAAPKSNKLGDVAKCPACGALVESFSTKCADCGHEFRNIEASKSIIKFFEKLDKIESKRIEPLPGTEKKEYGTSGRTLIKWWLFWWILIPVSLFKLIFQSRSTAWSTTDARKEELIMNFPIPNAREEILEFMTLAHSKVTKVSFLKKLKEEGRYIARWNKIWMRKMEQVMTKAKLAMKDDKSTLQELEKLTFSSDNSSKNKKRELRQLKASA